MLIEAAAAGALPAAWGAPADWLVVVIVVVVGDCCCCCWLLDGLLAPLVLVAVGLCWQARWWLWWQAADLRQCAVLIVLVGMFE